jgi:hypothetical protein
MVTNWYCYYIPILRLGLVEPASYLHRVDDINLNELFTVIVHEKIRKLFEWGIRKSKKFSLHRTRRSGRRDAEVNVLQTISTNRGERESEITNLRRSIVWQVFPQGHAANDGDLRSLEFRDSFEDVEHYQTSAL